MDSAALPSLDPAADKDKASKQRVQLALRGFLVILLLSAAASAWHFVSEYDKSRTASRCFDAMVSRSRDAHIYAKAEYQSLLACGQSAVVPVVVDALEGGDISPRYQPEPIGILNEFPRAAQRELHRRLSEGLKPNNDPRFSAMKNRGIDLERRSCLIYGLIAVADDWSYLEQWLADAQVPERQEWTGGLSGYSMNLLVSTKLERLGAPHLLFANDPFNWRVNPEFVTWWTENGARVLHPEK